ncbi:RNA exonuclease 1 homolog isoform X2 [Photinus pyralis]|nr:RNA exonuclease 1 homolog isoform X2 [Photinus pyralis]XP_031354942.1 RNA exonuclease 1 homolog isoform X2 [Photinus pyralis]XP_031354943.1 RNA exonuclease 1 homolog isoform X2 [Photinus pyralis]XP_031354944.1 RNA exonuclease 1 homolog isoform X2 [Photinus pyralis]
MDFSSNGKYLASCADEEPDPGGKLQDGGTSSSNNDSSHETSVPSSESPSPRTGLSRRQRKNRRRDDSSPEQKRKFRNRKSELAVSRKPIVHTPLKQFLKIGNIPESQLASLMQTFFLSPEQMLIMGYPLEYSGYCNRAIIFKSPLTMPKAQQKFPQKSAPRYSKINVKESKFDVNAQEFVPGMDYSEIKAEWNANHDSGQGSASSSVSEENDSEGSSTSLDCYPLTPPDSDAGHQETPKPPQLNDYEIGESHNCVRCGNVFFISNHGEYLTQEQCTYHWGKLHSVIATMGKHTRTCCYVTEYSCCHGKPNSRGCTVGKLHVWNGTSVGFNGPYDSYVRTRPRKTLPPDGNFGVYALDCEMCYTVQGLELTKVTVIGVDGRLVYDSFVKPESEIIDYNTRFSGITEKDLSSKSGIKSLREVQNDIMGFVNADTILIGHGLENDLRALRIMHYTVVDTAVVFAHPNGLPYRRALKSITSCVLKRDIQCSASGHNSYEDARACMELILWKVRRDFLKPMDPY